MEAVQVEILSNWNSIRSVATVLTTWGAATAASYGSTVGRTTAAAGEHLQLQIEHTSMKGSQFEAKKSQEVDVLSCLTRNAFHS